MTDTQSPDAAETSSATAAGAAAAEAGGAGRASVVHHGHGNSIAAWTAVILIIVGSTVIGFGVVFTSWAMSIVGTVICIVGAISGKVLSTMGFGVAGRGGH